MNFELTDEQRMLREMVREFSEKEIKPRAAEIDRTDEFPWDLWKRMAELGILGMTLPPEYGGSGMDIVSWAIAQEEMARASVVVADIQLLSTLMQNMILKNGTDAQKKKYLPALGLGEKICIIAQTEPGAPAGGIETTAKPRNGYVLNGTKRRTAPHDLRCVATVDKSKGHKGITLFLVEKGTPGFSPGSKEHLMGVKGMGTGEVVLDNCWVPKENLLGGEGEGFKRAMMSLDTGRIGIGCQAVGLAQAAMEEAIRYAKQRTAFGGPIANLQAIQFMLADMSAGIEAARLRLRHAAWLKDQGRSIIREAAEAKLLASDLAVKVTADALQIHVRAATVTTSHRADVSEAKVYQIGRAPARSSAS
jgi:alkylation response protein AidB-like acyl-CoA dehydrogenase